MQKTQIPLRDFIGTLPFCLLCTIMGFTVYQIGFQNLSAGHIWALILLGANIIVYAINYKMGILFNCLVFILTMATLINPYTGVTTVSLFVSKSGNSLLPPMEIWSLLLFLIYFFINIRTIKKYFYFVIDKLPY